MTPLVVKLKMKNETASVPCGKCPKCVKRRASSWSFRLMQEEKNSSSAMFVTLTYDTKQVPLTRNGYMSLDKRGIQLFFKSLRKLHDQKLKYYIVGEYGGKTMRPHYHMILFNADIEKVDKCWTFGSKHFGSVSGASIGYSLKYISKKKRVPLHQNDDREREFGLMSKKLGLSYVTPEMIEWHKADMHGRMYCNLQDGKKITMPRYFKQKIYNEYERKAIGFHARSQMLRKEDKARKKYGENYHRDIASSHMGAFRKMEKDSVKGDKL